MDDLISRQAAIDAIDKYSVWVTYTQGDSQKDEAEFAENIIKQTKKAIQSMLIEDLPSAQPEQKKGMWIIRDNPGTGWYRVTCSECGEDVTSTIPMIGFFPNAKPLWDYCPYCGCKMEVEDNGKQ